MNDIFRPKHNPAQSLYDVFQTEAEKRPKRELEEWQRKEVMAVYEEALRWHERNPEKYKEITVADVQDAQRQAWGHVDYGAKWAYAVVERMRY